MPGLIPDELTVAGKQLSAESAFLMEWRETPTYDTFDRV
jgi:hypothetical protein